MSIRFPTTSEFPTANSAWTETRSQPSRLHPSSAVLLPKTAALDRSILVVDDNLNDLTLVRIALQQVQQGIVLRTVRRGQEAIDLLSPHSGVALPGLVLLDLNLPGLNGIEVLQSLRAVPYTQFIPIVIMSSSSNAADIYESYHHGANSYVGKPLDFSTTLNVIKMLVTYWFELNQSVELAAA